MTEQTPLQLPEGTKKLLFKLHADNPVASALVFKRVLDAVLCKLLGLPPAHVTTSSPDPDETMGIFGRLRAYFGCIECQHAGTLHAHCAVWLDLSPAVFSRIAVHRHLIEAVTSVLNSMFVTAAPVEVHARDLLDKYAAHVAAEVAQTEADAAAEADEAVSHAPNPRRGLAANQRFAASVAANR
jgi:hypothetical protein